MKQIKTEVIINCNIEKVWHILMNFNEYPKWNSFIKHIQRSENNKLEVRIQPPNKKMMLFSPSIIDEIPNKKFSWKGKFLFSGLFDGEHFFELISNNDGSTTFVHSEKFTGILLPFIDLSATKKGFVLMNNELKTLAEN